LVLASGFQSLIRPPDRCCFGRRAVQSGSAAGVAAELDAPGFREDAEVDGRRRWEAGLLHFWLSGP
jgi:hypothetical protein